MDIFCYRYILGFKTISKYCVIELKKDKCTKESIQQIMKYVDWVNQEYAYGDYAMIEAYLICSDFSKDIITYKKEVCIRNYTKGRRPIISASWNNIKFIKYTYHEQNGLTLKEVE